MNEEMLQEQARTLVQQVKLLLSKYTANELSPIIVVLNRWYGCGGVLELEDVVESLFGKPQSTQTTKETNEFSSRQFSKNERTTFVPGNDGGVS